MKSHPFLVVNNREWATMHACNHFLDCWEKEQFHSQNFIDFRQIITVNYRAQCNRRLDKGQDFQSSQECKVAFSRKKQKYNFLHFVVWNDGCPEVCNKLDYFNLKRWALEGTYMKKSLFLYISSPYNYKHCNRS